MSSFAHTSAANSDSFRFQVRKFGSETLRRDLKELQLLGVEAVEMGLLLLTSSGASDVLSGVCTLVPFIDIRCSSRTDVKASGGDLGRVSPPGRKVASLPAAVHDFSMGKPRGDTPQEKQVASLPAAVMIFR